MSCYPKICKWYSFLLLQFLTLQYKLFQIVLNNYAILSHILGKHGTESVEKEGFKKGHNVKSFKKSHHLDETGKTEEFYDESHDEGGNYAFDGRSGLFGENKASSFKGGHEDGKYTSGEAKKEGHFDNEYIVDKAQSDQGKYGGNKYAQNEELYGNNKGIGESGLSGHHDASNFYKKFPHYY